jgi:carbonic anhydrase
MATPLTAEQAWRKLVAGNNRFVAGEQQHPHESLEWRESLVNGQHPFAVILGCADSRVSPELVFDEGLGDLFVIRAAGEVLDTAVIGSIEYAVEHLSVPLVVVLGHESCGAVGATIDVVQHGTEVAGDISTLVRSIEPAVRATPANPDPAAFLAACVAEQARRAAQYLPERSNIISDAVAHHGVKVVSATYELDTGKVTRL